MESCMGEHMIYSKVLSAEYGGLYARLSRTNAARSFPKRTFPELSPDLGVGRASGSFHRAAYCSRGYAWPEIRPRGLRWAPLKEQSVCGARSVL
jgi:hypothetical protein